MNGLVRGTPRDKSIRILKLLYRYFPFSVRGSIHWENRSDMYDLSIVIPTHLRSEHPPHPTLQTCLLSLSEQEIPKSRFEVIVVEDGPSSDVVQKAIESFRSHLTLHHLAKGDHSLPLGGLRNQGILHAQGRWVMMMDDDAFLSEDFLLRFFSLISHLDPERDILLPQGIARFGILQERFDFLEDYSLGTGCILYPRTLLKKVGGFNSSLPCLEDIDLAIRSLLVGANTVKAEFLRYFHPPLHLPLGSPISMARGYRYSSAYRQLKKTYSRPVWTALVVKDLLKLPHLFWSTSAQKKTLAVLAFYTLLGLIKNKGVKSFVD